MSVAVEQPNVVVSADRPVVAVAAVQFPARASETRWPATRLSGDALAARLTSPPFVLAQRDKQTKRVRGVRLLVGWLADQAGRTWQERWLSSGADTAGAEWRQVPVGWLHAHGERSAYRHQALVEALPVAISADVIRPSLTWLVSGGPARGGLFLRTLAASRDPDGFARLAAACDADPGVSVVARGQTLYRAAMIVAAKGGTLGDITVGDLIELFDAQDELAPNAAAGRTLLYRLLHQMGVLGPGAPPTLRALRTAGQSSPEELIDRYRLSCRPIRDLLIEYLRERQPALDYNSLESLANYLGKLFWSDLERHHPGIDSLHLSVEVTEGWKQRLRTVTKTITTATGDKTQVAVERINYRECLTPVRAFYLDIAHWAVEDPGRWAVWVAPCPIGEEEINRKKAKRKRKSRMDARTRERLPVLPVLVRIVAERRTAAAALLDAARETRPGEAFSAAGTTLVRSTVEPRSGAGKVWAHDPADRRRRDLVREEDHAFWAWAIVEVLRATGVRVEELRELSHHSLVQYRLPTTGEIVPLLQILPSKTDTERLLVVSPELADVLSVIILRVSDGTGVVPLVPAYDTHERMWSAPAPLLFQRRLNTENRVIADSMVRTILTGALAHTGLVDSVDGQPLRYTPHDFRRMFITDAMMNGLPHRTSPRSSPATATSTSRSDTRPSTPKKPCRPTSPSSLGDDHCGPATNTAPPPTRTGKSSSVTSSDARSPSAPALKRSRRRASTNTPASAARCCGPTRNSSRASSRSATTSPHASPKQNEKAGSAKSKDSRSASPAHTRSSTRSTIAHTRRRAHPGPHDLSPPLRRQAFRHHTNRRTPQLPPFREGPGRSGSDLQVQRIRPDGGDVCASGRCVEGRFGGDGAGGQGRLGPDRRQPAGGVCGLGGVGGGLRGVLRRGQRPAPSGHPAATGGDAWRGTPPSAPTSGASVDGGVRGNPHGRLPATDGAVGVVPVLGAVAAGRRDGVGAPPR